MFQHLHCCSIHQTQSVLRVCRLLPAKKCLSLNVHHRLLVHFEVEVVHTVFLMSGCKARPVVPSCGRCCLNHHPTTSIVFLSCTTVKHFLRYCTRQCIDLWSISTHPAHVATILVRIDSADSLCLTIIGTHLVSTSLTIAHGILWCVKRSQLRFFGSVQLHPVPVFTCLVPACAFGVPRRTDIAPNNHLPGVHTCHNCDIFHHFSRCLNSFPCSSVACRVFFLYLCFCLCGCLFDVRKDVQKTVQTTRN